MSADLPLSRTLKREGKGEKKKEETISKTLTFLYREGTNSSYKMPPTPLRQIYSKICVCLERPRAVRLSATIAKEVSRCRDNFSDCSAMGDPRPAEGGRWIPRPPWILTDVIYLLHGHLLFPVHLSPSCSVRAPVSTSSKHTHVHTHKQGGIRQRRRHKLDRDGFLNDVSGLTADDYDKKQFPSQFQVTFPSSVCPIYLCFFF